MHFYVVFLVILELFGVIPSAHRRERRTICLCQIAPWFPETYNVQCACGCRGLFDGGKCCLRCPVKTKSSDDEAGCFHGDAQLVLDDGKMIKMEDLKAGHRVLTVQDGQRVYSEVRTFLKRQPNNNGTYWTLTTEQGNHVTMTGNHIIFVSRDNQSTNMESGFAMTVKPGDYIFSTKGCPHGLCPERVVQVSIGVKEGLYVPLTDAGTLVVDGMLASCYSFTYHDLEHFFVTPFRWFPWLLHPWQQDGYSPIMSGLEYLGELFLPGTIKTLS
ncbi:indian hedgehog protein-like [Gigantopelta aegis]|uniref:indian hedgehog protein-like n=1 Tax=Gigantopelta aegis TaxID=1735272 RepID=UPI001B8887C3|nr:indian hedgehog protein-like [Gigantopelta aegis]